VCIPAFNAEKTVGDVVKRCLQYADKVIVCDDGSTDDTARIAKISGADVTSHAKNMGKGAAMRTLFKLAEGKNPDVVVTIDADGQFLPEEIPKLISPVLESKSDVVIGYRFEKAMEMPAYRKFGNKFLDKVANLASNLSFRDTQSGFRAYSKKTLGLINFSTDGFGADAEILVNLSTKGLRISEEKVTVIYDTGGKTSTHNPFSHGTSVFLNTLRYVSVKKPLTFFGIPGIILIIIGSGFGFYFLDNYLHERIIYLGSLGAGVLLFAFGTIMCVTSIILFTLSTLIRSRD